MASHTTGRPVFARCALAGFNNMFLRAYSLHFSLLGVGEEEHEQRVDKTHENEWHEVLRILLIFLPCSIKCGNFNPIDHSATRLKNMMNMARVSPNFLVDSRSFTTSF